jgi:uncharacterized protein YyaL (SSP411 family)
MDETTFSAPEIISLANSSLVPVRVDTDRYPHVMDHYIAGGWPTNAFLTPTGEVLWSGTYTSAETLGDVAHRVLTAWRERRGELDPCVSRVLHLCFGRVTIVSRGCHARQVE